MTASFYLDLHAMAQMSAARMVDCLVEGTLIALFAGLVSHMARRQNSGVRFAVWFSALMAMAALPLFGGAGVAHGAASPLATLAHWPQITLPSSWAVYLFWAWVATAGVGVARVCVGLWRLSVLRRSCAPVDLVSLRPELRESLEPSTRNAQTRTAALCVSERVSVPTVLGLVKPTVVIPRWLMEELTPSELRQILLHEIAHLRRWDDWTNLAQKLVKAVLFFHPAVWWIEKQVSIEREMACDDAVVAETANPRAYAACLTHLAEKSFVRRSLALAQAALGRVRQTSLRVAQILDADRPTATSRGWIPAVTVVAVFAVACTGVVSRAPRLVAFEDGRLAMRVDDRSSRLDPTYALTADHYAAAATSDLSLRPREAKFRSLETRPVSAKRRRNKRRENFDSSHVAALTAAMVNANGIAPTTPPTPEDLLHLTDFVPNSAVVTETVFVVVESREPGFTGAAAYRISVWRIVVQSPAVSPNPNTIPHKET